MTMAVFESGQASFHHGRGILDERSAFQESCSIGRVISRSEAIASRGPWTATELVLLDQKVTELGRRWTAISAFFPDRSPNQVKNCWIGRHKPRAPTARYRSKRLPRPITTISSLPSQTISSPSTPTTRIPLTRGIPSFETSLKRHHSTDHSPVATPCPQWQTSVQTRDQ